MPPSWAGSTGFGVVVLRGSQTLQCRIPDTASVALRNSVSVRHLPRGRGQAPSKGLSCRRHSFRATVMKVGAVAPKRPARGRLAVKLEDPLFIDAAIAVLGSDLDLDEPRFPFDSLAVRARRASAG